MVTKEPTKADSEIPGRMMGPAKDPVCGMDVNPNKSYSAMHDNTEYRFCSLSCVEKFKADPEKFVRR